MEKSNNYGLEFMVLNPNDVLMQPPTRKSRKTVTRNNDLTNTIHKTVKVINKNDDVYKDNIFWKSYEDGCEDKVIEHIPSAYNIKILSSQGKLQRL